jgi:hypothetical protein
MKRALPLVLLLATSCGGSERPQSQADAADAPPLASDGGFDGQAPSLDASAADAAIEPDAATASEAGVALRDPIVAIEPVDPVTLAPDALPDDVEGELVIAFHGGGCLSAREASAGSAVEVRVCRGLSGQRWRIQGGVLSLVDAPMLCLDDAQARFRLSVCSTLTQNWRLASDGVIEKGNRAADLTQGGELISYGTHRGDNQRWALLSADLALVEGSAQQVSYPLAASDAAGYALEQARHRVGAVQPPYPLRAARDVSTFPGDVADTVPRVSRRVQFDRRFDHDQAYLRVSWPNQNWQSTGLYAPAGALFVVDVPVGSRVEGLFVRLNVHTDRLTPTSGNVMGGSFERMPIITLRLPLVEGVNALRTPYGGEIVFESTLNTMEAVALDVHGAVEMPRFVRGVTSADEWRRRRALPVPWAELEGARAVVHVPSDQIRTLDDPASVMARYDRVVQLQAELAGLDASSGVHRMYDGKIRFVADLQITGGSGHSGFPIMATLDWDFADARTGGDEWGVWHELGHNHQQSCWSGRFGTESTVNLFSLYVQRKLHDTSRIAGDYDDVIDALEQRSITFASADVWQKLVFLMQPVHALPRGWTIYQRVNRAYRELGDAERSRICADEQSQLDGFYRILSTAAEVDLRDHFARWGLTVSQAARDAVHASGLQEPSVTVWRARD